MSDKAHSKARLSAPEDERDVIISAAFVHNESSLPCASSKSRYRWMFEGSVDPQMHSKYVGKRVAGVASQSPTLWRGPQARDQAGPEIIQLRKKAPDRG
jgi:hypothetical protein